MRYPMEFDEQVKAAGSGTLISGFPAYVFTMDAPVDGDALRYGVEQSMRCHPLFCCRMVRSEEHVGEYEWEDNDLPAVVEHKDRDADCIFGDESNNYYPWIVTFDDCDVVYTCTHALTDGMGAVEFMKTVLYCYSERLGETMENDGSVLLPESATEKQITAQLELPAVVHGATPCDGIGNLDPLPVAQVDPRNYEPADADADTFSIRLPERDLKDCARKHNVTPTLCLVYYFAKAMVPLLEERKDAVKVLMAVDARSLIGSTTMHNCAYGVPLFYDVERFEGRPEELIMNVLRSKLDLAIDESNVRKMLYGMNRARQMARENPAIIEQAVSAGVDSLDKVEAQIVYSHLTRVRMPATLSNHITGITIGGKVTSSMFLVCGATYRNTVKLTVFQRSRGSRFVYNIVDLLKADGLECSVDVEAPRGSSTFTFCQEGR